MKKIFLSILLITFAATSIGQAFAMASVECSKMENQAAETTSMDMGHDMHAMHKMEQGNIDEPEKDTDCCGSADSCPMQQCAVTVPVYLSQASFLYEFNTHHSETYTYSTFYSSRYLDTPYRPPILG